MKTFLKYTLAVILGLVAFTIALAVPAIQEGSNNAFAFICQPDTWIPTINTYLFTPGTTMIGAAVILPATGRRAAYERCLQWLRETTGSDEYTISQGDLRLEAVLDKNLSTYKFDTLGIGNAAQRPLEKKLNRNDLFFITDIALCITKQDAVATVKKYSNYPLYTFPDPQVFVGINGSSQTEVDALQTIYNSELTLITGSQKRNNGILTHNFRQLTDYAQGTALKLPLYGANDSERGYYPIEPTLVLTGKQDNSFELVLGAGEREVIAGGINASNVAVNTTNVAVLMLKGFFASNAAESSSRWFNRDQWVLS